MTQPIEVKATIKFTDEQIMGLLRSGFEGGVGYWCRIEDYKFADGLTYDDFREGGKMQGKTYWHPCQLVPLTPGCAVICIEHEEEDPKPLKLNRPKIEVGLQLMADKFPRHFGNFMNENHDAETGDVFIQLCLLGDVVYG